MRSLLAGLSNRKEFGQWIGGDHLIQETAMVVDNLSRGAIPASRIRRLAPEGNFSAIEKSPDFYVMDFKGYHRFDIYADTLQSLDISEGTRIYRRLKSLFDLAYQELGYSESNFSISPGSSRLAVC